MPKSKKLNWDDIKCITEPVPAGYFLAVAEGLFVVCWNGNFAGSGYVPHRPIKIFKDQKEALELLNFFNDNHKFYNRPHLAEQFVLHQKQNAFLTKATKDWETL